MIPILIIIAIVVGIPLAVWYSRRPKAGSIEARVNAITNRWADSAGFIVMLETGASVSDMALDAIEKGLLHCFAKARCQSYQNNLQLGAYEIAIIKGEPDSSGDPAYRVPAGPYAGSEFDKGGYILVAGEVIDQKSNLIVIPEHGDDKLEHLSRIVEYEAEHCILYANNRAEYERTKVHGQGTGHPIIPECAADLGVNN